MNKRFKNQVLVLGGDSDRYPICQIEHSRHQNPENFFINLLSGLIAYTFLPNKPSIRLNKKDYEILKLSYPIAI